MAFENERGEQPEGCVSWQFNFKFNLREDMYAQDSIDLLKEVRLIHGFIDSFIRSMIDRLLIDSRLNIFLVN